MTERSRFAIKVQRRCPYCRRVTMQLKVDERTGLATADYRVSEVRPHYVCDECCGMSNVDEEIKP